MPTQQLDYFASLVSEDEHFPLTEAAIAVAQHSYPDLIVQHAEQSSLGRSVARQQWLLLSEENAHLLTLATRSNLIVVLA